MTWLVIGLSDGGSASMMTVKVPPRLGVPAAGAAVGAAPAGAAGAGLGALGWAPAGALGGALDGALCGSRGASGQWTAKGYDRAAEGKAAKKLATRHWRAPRLRKSMLMHDQILLTACCWWFRQVRRL